MSTPARVAVIGASLAGVRVLKALRRKGFDGELVLIGDENELPYDRPPLSKQYLTGDDPAAVKLLEPESFYDDVELRLGLSAVRLDLADRAVTLDDGSSVRADHVVIATGARARTLAQLPDGPRIARLRTVADARRIRAAFVSCRRLLVVGGGFIGCEVAASARRRSLEVVLVEPLAAPVVRGVGAFVGGTIAAVHRDNGVDVRVGVAVAGVEHLADRLVVMLTDGSRVEADFAVVGVGATAATEWLAGSGIEATGGVACDDRCRVAGGGGGVWAVGDVAVWPSRLSGGPVRVEHWTNAAEQASVLAANLLDDSSDMFHDPVPYVWSDQYEHRIQILGSVHGDDETTLVSGSVEDRKFALAYSREGRICGLVAFDSPREVVAMRTLIAQSALMADVA